MPQPLVKTNESNTNQITETFIGMEIGHDLAFCDSVAGKSASHLRDSLLSHLNDYERINGRASRIVYGFHLRIEKECARSSRKIFALNNQPSFDIAWAYIINDLHYLLDQQTQQNFVIMVKFQFHDPRRVFGALRSLDGEACEAGRKESLSQPQWSRNGDVDMAC